MQPYDIFSDPFGRPNTEAVSAIYSVRREEEHESKSSPGASSPSSWGSDTVSISDEARAAAQSLAKPEDNREAAEEDSAEAEFAKFMEKAKGNVGSDGGGSGGIEDQIKALQAKLKDLQAQLSQAASSDGPGQASRIDSLNAQVNSVTAQIAELAAQLAEQESA